jgi:hypothetical protein
MTVLPRQTPRRAGSAPERQTVTVARRCRCPHRRSEFRPRASISPVAPGDSIGNASRSLLRGVVGMCCLVGSKAASPRNSNHFLCACRCAVGKMLRPDEVIADESAKGPRLSSGRADHGGCDVDLASVLRSRGHREAPGLRGVPCYPPPAGAPSASDLAQRPTCAVQASQAREPPRGVASGRARGKAVAFACTILWSPATGRARFSCSASNSFKIDTVCERGTVRRVAAGPVVFGGHR